MKPISKAKQLELARTLLETELPVGSLLRERGISEAQFVELLRDEDFRALLEGHALLAQARLRSWLTTRAFRAADGFISVSQGENPESARKACADFFSVYNWMVSDFVKSSMERPTPTKARELSERQASAMLQALADNTDASQLGEHND